MADNKVLKKSTRDGFGEGLLALGEKDPRVVVVSGDLTESTRAGWFREKYPDRFISCGVAEQDMMGVAAGLALAGKLPFACTFGIFASGRAWDQIRVSLSYMNLNVTVVGTHGGLTVGEDGATHQALEEITLMRCLPRMTVIMPCDAVQAKMATIQSVEVEGPVYLRLGRNSLPVITSEDVPYKIGKANILKEGSDITIIACGVMVAEALAAAAELKGEGIDAEVIDMHTIKPLDGEALLKSAVKTGLVITAEEHTVIGGLGGAVSEFLSQNYPVKMRMIGVPDKFGESGAPQQLLDKYGLNSDNIKVRAREMLGGK